MHWVPTGQIVNKEYYVEVLREFRKRFLGKRPALFKSGISTRTMHQSTTPSLCHVIAHGDEEVRLILSSRVELAVSSSQKATVKRECGSQRG